MAEEIVMSSQYTLNIPAIIDRLRMTYHAYGSDKPEGVEEPLIDELLCSLNGMEYETAYALIVDEAPFVWSVPTQTLTIYPATEAVSQ